MSKGSLAVSLNLKIVYRHLRKIFHHKKTKGNLGKKKKNHFIKHLNGRYKLERERRGFSRPPYLPLLWSWACLGGGSAVRG